MNEVSAQTVAILLDCVEQHGMEADLLWQGLPVRVSSLRSATERFDWDTWIEMIDRVAAASPVPMEELFVTGSGRRVGHPFARIAGGLLSLRDLYSLFARWGVRRSFHVFEASFEELDRTHARFTIKIDPARRGSLPSLRMCVGLLAHLPDLQGYAPAKVNVTSLSEHALACDLVLPADRGFFQRARTVVRSLAPMSTALDELARQGEEIASKNLELQRQLGAMRERDEWLEVALDAGKIGLWRWDPATRRVRISGGLVDWLATGGATEIDTVAWRKHIHPDDQPGITKVMAESLMNKSPFDTAYRIVRPSGEIMWLHLKGRVDVDDHGRFYAFGSAVDVTAERLMESQLRLADRLISAGTLAAGVAHEINNPLTYVLGSAELLQRRLAAHPAALATTGDLLAQMLDGIERIRSVVSDVRVFARQDENTLGPVDLRTVCAAAVRIVSTDVRHSATISVDLAADTPCVRASEAKLGQVVINLLVNASQAMPERSVGENSVQVRSRKLASGEAAIEVEDNGVGIAADVLPRVFDPFFTTKPVGVGTGLGLAVCAGIVASLGGRIEIDSEVGRGTRFTVILPSIDAVATEPTAPAAIAAPVRPSHVLVIDDEPTIRSVVARSLAAHGFEVDEAATGREGLSRALAGDHQVILCDLMMPDLDGAALHAHLSERRPDLASRVVFISGGAVTERVRAFLERPDVVVVQKPFALEQLVAAITRAAEAV